jgi:hypothetical protein
MATTHSTDSKRWWGPAEPDPPGRVAWTTVQPHDIGVFARLEDGERTDVNENTPRLVANPKRTQIHTEADLRRGAAPTNPETEPAADER